IADVVTRASYMGKVFWTIPTVKKHRAGYGVYALSSRGTQVYRFFDGEGSDESTTEWCLHEIVGGPGAEATDERSPELGADLTVVRQSKISMATALANMETKYGPAIEA